MSVIPIEDWKKLNENLTEEEYKELSELSKLGTHQNIDIDSASKTLIEVMKQFELYDDSICKKLNNM